MNDLEKKEYKFNEDSFKLVQSDKKIFDQKFETKTTTFAKDALKRFAKNKSSVAGAIILGILVLLTIFVPMLSPYQIEVSQPDEKILPPKLFEAGTGFWDGTKHFENIAWDPTTKLPAETYGPAVLNLKKSETPTYINNAHKYGEKGYLHFINEDNSSKKQVKKLMGPKIDFGKDEGVTATIIMNNEDGIAGNRLGEFRIGLKIGSKVHYLTEDFVSAKDYSEDQPIVFDLSQILIDNKLSKATKAQLIIELKANENEVGGKNVLNYVLIKQIIFNAKTPKDEALNEALEIASIIDANKSILIQPIPGKNPDLTPGYWRCSGQKNAYKVEQYLCSYDYDYYALRLDAKDGQISPSEMQTYVDKGWCDFKYELGEDGLYKVKFVKLSEKCPINAVYDEDPVNYPVTKDEANGVTSFTANITRYKYKGYDKMPLYLFGTDEQGHDLITKAFTGLRTSLILGICTAAFCLAFGLCWGAISGYFGGNIDLAMERFCEILGGVPWIVVMTLCILHLGNNFLTFFLALCLTGWLSPAARTRTQFYRFKGREYILASRTLGASDGRLIFKHILPNALGTIVTGSVLMIPSTIFSEATLAYLNLGLTGVQSFGVMMSDNQKFISTDPHLIVFPAVIMALMMISFNLFGNGLRDALNPSLKGAD